MVDHADVPLAVDLDDTLIEADLSVGSVLFLLTRAPRHVFSCLVWLLRGRDYCKRQIALRVALNAGALPYNEELLAFLRQESRGGRTLILATASDLEFAREVADHLGIFKDVLASEPGRNLKGEVKCRALVEKYGEKGFDYAGDACCDLKVWRHARAAIVVGSPEFSERVSKTTKVSRTFPAARRPLASRNFFALK